MRFAVVLLVTGPMATAVAQPSGEAYLNGAASHLTSSTGSGTLVGFTLGFGIGSPTLAVGPELVFQNSDSLRVRGFGGVVRLRQGGRGVHPHLVAGLGTYAWQRRVPVGDQNAAPGLWREVRRLSGAIGAGATLGPWRGLVTGMVEGRVHRNLSQGRGEGSRTLFGIEAGLRIGW